MNTKIALIIVSASAVLAGCGPSQAAPTPEEKKSFMGGPMPKDFQKNNIPGAGGPPPGANEAAQKAMAANKANHQ